MTYGFSELGIPASVLGHGDLALLIERVRARNEWSWQSRSQSSARDFSVVASCGLLPGPAHELFGSRKLRLAPQDYSPWTPPTDRLSGRSYPPASRHPPVLDLVGSTWDEHGADGTSPGHARLPRMRDSYGPKSGPNAGPRARSPGDQAAA